MFKTFWHAGSKIGEYRNWANSKNRRPIWDSEDKVPQKNPKFWKHIMNYQRCIIPTKCHRPTMLWKLWHSQKTYSSMKQNVRNTWKISNVTVLKWHWKIWRTEKMIQVNNHLYIKLIFIYLLYIVLILILFILQHMKLMRIISSRARVEAKTYFEAIELDELKLLELWSREMYNVVTKALKTKQSFIDHAKIHKVLCNEARNRLLRIKYILLF